jgi:hypothetical protein
MSEVMSPPGVRPFVEPAKNIFDFRVRFFRVFALLGASVIGAGLKNPGHAALTQVESSAPDEPGFEFLPQRQRGK